MYMNKDFFKDLGYKLGSLFATVVLLCCMGVVIAIAVKIVLMLF